MSKSTSKPRCTKRHFEIESSSPLISSLRKTTAAPRKLVAVGRVTLLRKHAGGRMDEKKEREEKREKRGEARMIDDCTRAISMTMRAFENAPLSSFIVRAVSSWPRLMRLSSILGTVNGTPARLLENEKGSRSVEPREKLVDFQFVKEFSYYCYIICCYMIFIFYIKNYLVIILRR